MLAGDFILARPVHQPVQGEARKHIHSFMGAQRAGLKLHIVRVLRRHARYQIVDQAGIDQRGIAGDPEQGLGARGFRRQPVALQHIAQRTTDASDFLLRTELLKNVVAGIRRGGDRNGIHRSALPQAVKDVPQERLARDRHQHLARKARGAHPRLDDGDDAMRRTRHQAGVQVSRMCLKGRRPSDGSARHSRSASSAGTGSLKPVPSAVKA